MPRPSQGLDRALLEAGIEEIKLGGVRGLSVRAICARAGVNIRMLNYYFGSKDDYVRILLTKTYEHYFNALRNSVESGDDPLERLMNALRVSMSFAMQNHDITRSLWMDANSGVPLVKEMVEKVFPRHTNLMFELLYEAWKNGTLRQDIPPMQIFTAVLPGVFSPCLWGEKYFPQLPPEMPAELGMPPVDPVEAAMQNFACLLQGFMAESTGKYIAKAPCPFVDTHADNDGGSHFGDNVDPNFTHLQQGRSAAQKEQHESTCA